MREKLKDIKDRVRLHTHTTKFLVKKKQKSSHGKNENITQNINLGRMLQKVVLLQGVNYFKTIAIKKVCYQWENRLLEMNMEFRNRTTLTWKRWIVHQMVLGLLVDTEKK